MTGTVLEEGLRGAGGYLLNGKGERFMFNYDERGERATRDIVSRGIYDEMRKGNTSPNGGVYIAMSHLGVENVRRQFKGMVKRCADCGFDLAGGQVEVVPTAHYFMGGLICDTDTRTDLAGLFVAGEDAGGVHGANRLGGNGVANSTVFGGVAGEVMASYVEGVDDWLDADETMLASEVKRALLPFNISGDAVNVNDLREKLMDIMWQDVGVMRTAEGIQQGISRVKELRGELLQSGIGAQNRVFNLTWHDWLNLYNLIDISLVIAKAALSRENSRGAHCREDFPEPGAMEDSYFTVVRSHDESLDVVHEPVEFSIIKPGESLVENYSETAPQVKQ